MIEVAQYLKENYYPRYKGCKPEMVPCQQLLVTALEIHASKVITVYKNKQISGVAVYVTLDDATYEHLESFDMTRIDVVSRLLMQEGQNFHFILVAADGKETLRTGIRIAKALNPKSISWWNPTMTKLHKYSLN